jgi:signal transduction histidine kinase
MAAVRRVRGQRWEFAVALLGGLSSALLIAVALAPANDPELAGRASFAEAARRAEDLVVAEWERLRLDPDALELAEPRRWRQGEREESARTPPTSRPAAPNGAAPNESVVFELLAREAQRLEALGKPADARAAAQDAREQAQHSAGRARAALVAIRCSRALGDADAARAAWSALEGELTGAELDADVPLLAACALAVAPALQADARAALQARLVAGVTGGTLELGEGAARQVWLERIGELAPGGSALAKLRESERTRELDLLARARPAGRLPERPSDGAWRFEPHPARHALLAWRADGADGVLAGFVTRVDLIENLTARLAQRALVPDGFALDFGLPGDDVPGERVRERRELDAAGLGFELFHEDPNAAIARAGQRVALLRGALFLTAALSAGASIATFRALRRGRRLAELKSSFVASVSHELRTPVASILMLAENLEENRVSEPAARERYASLIRREAERLRRLVADVLDFSRLERGRQLELRRESRALDALLAELSDAAREWAHKHGVELSLELAADGATSTSVNVDAEALRRALENLLDNARKHSGSTQIALSARSERGALHLEVRDRGRGIPLEQRAKVFEPFERLESTNGAGGAGLGLAIVREIAREHGGEARALEPLDGVGARLAIELPLEQPAESGA